jgi:nitric oxide reductase NorD protein
MTALPRLTAEHIERLLDEWLEADMTRCRVDTLAVGIAALARDEQDFVLGWVQRLVAAHIQIAYQFARFVPPLLASMEPRLIEAWVLHALDDYDRVGLQAAIKAMQDVNQFVRRRHERAAGAVFGEVSGILLPFLHGLSGRPLRMAEADGAYTDTETVYLPAVVADLERAEDNFQLCKAIATLLWAQIRFGTFRDDPGAALSRYPDPAKACRCYHALETLRLEACIARELPGLARQIVRLKSLLGEDAPPSGWDAWVRTLARPQATAADSLRLVAQVYAGAVHSSVWYGGELRLAAASACLQARVAKEKMQLRVKLAQLIDEMRPPQARPDQSEGPPPTVKLAALEDASAPGAYELILDDMPVAPPDGVRQLLTSIELDLGEIPPEYLVPAGDGEYDVSACRETARDPDDVWKGTYHEEGAVYHHEWDFGRQHYRKNWCVMREKDVAPVRDDFVAGVMERYGGLVRQLRRTFEALRDKDRLLKRQSQGDNVDIDALVEAVAEASRGMEMSDRLYMRMHRSERNIAVMFMVDMSGSTKGWINDAERESLLLLCEALETLGDRYAIYGFSGMTRKRCELFRIKRFDEPYDDDVRARISGIRPQDYTRMGFAIRHLSRLLNEVDARTKLLITLSDGKPDDYHDGYRGRYGIEDTRKALQEASRAGIRPFCITIDQEARDYLPHLYGAAHYTVVDDVARLPFKVAEIYRRLTS